MDRTLTALGILLGICITWNAQALEITFLDVGEGEALILESEGQLALIDAGNPMTGARVVNFLREKGRASIDMAIITHPHADHFGGIFQILPYIAIEKRFDNGQDSTAGDDLFRWYRESFRSGNYHALGEGDQLKLGSVELEILNGFQAERQNVNQNSLVIRVSYGSTHALLMADAGFPVEEDLVAHRQDLKADLLKIGHHGHKDGTSSEFLDHVMPSTAVISTNCKNIRGYPATETVALLEKMGISVLTSCREGDMTFRSDGVSFSRIE